MKLNVILAVALFCSGFTWAQNKTQDAVYLHNGSMVRGHIIERIEGSHVKVQTVDGSTWVFQMDEIKEITTVESYHARKHISIREKGFYNITDLGVLAGRTDVRGVTSVSAQTVSGYQINRKLAVGAGIGLESFRDPLAPLFAEGRYYAMEGKFSPFVALQAGYGIPLNNYKDPEIGWVNKGGVMANGTIGIRNYLTSNIGLVLSAGYRYQQSIKRNYYGWLDPIGGTSQTRTEYSRIVLRVGLLFN